VAFVVVVDDDDDDDDGGGGGGITITQIMNIQRTELQK